MQILKVMEKWTSLTIFHQIAIGLLFIIAPFWVYFVIGSSRPPLDDLVTSVATPMATASPEQDVTIAPSESAATTPRHDVNTLSEPTEIMNAVRNSINNGLIGADILSVEPELISIQVFLNKCALALRDKYNNSYKSVCRLYENVTELVHGRQYNRRYISMWIKTVIQINSRHIQVLIWSKNGFRETFLANAMLNP
jgi:hypothetical protein